MATGLQIPRLLIAGASSGSGKTTVVVALAAALRARGLRVVCFKCGPDYLDPTWHAAATGARSHNLDGWMMGRDAVLHTFARAAAGADVALIEGVMGLYDGASPDGDEGSSAEIARWLEAPVLAVLDASGMARTVAALGTGLAAFDPRVQVCGLFANRVGSRSHLEILESACRRHLRVWGGLPKQPGLAFPERHLGLRTAAEAPEVAATCIRWGELLTEWADLDALLTLMCAAPPLPAPAPEPSRTARAAPRVRLGLAKDAAFHFYYDDNLRQLEELGAELVPFSPIADPLPQGLHGLYLGGGYPELHAAALSANSGLRESVRALAAAGAPLYAECGGFMYLLRALRTKDGQEHPMVGLLPGVAVMREKLQALGYVEVETTRDTPLGGPGLRFRGHQFRYSELQESDGDTAYRVRKRRDGSVSAEGYGRGNVLGSYVHAHWASNPLVPQNLVAACRRFAEAHP